MPRSGTTWLARHLAQHEHIAAFGESSFFGRHHVRPVRGQYRARELDKVLQHQSRRGWIETTGDRRDILPVRYASLVSSALRRAPCPTRPNDLFTLIVDEVSRATGASVVIEKTPHHIHCGRQLLHDFPDALALVMIRDPHEFARSFAAHQREREYAAMPAWLDRAYRHPAICAAWWVRYARSIRRTLAAAPARTLLVRSAELRRPDALMHRLSQFLGVDVQDLPIQPKLNSSFSGSVPAVDPRVVKWVRRIAGRELRHWAL